jgi:cytochrome c553
MPDVTKEAVAAEEQVHKLAERAAAAKDTTERVAVYGEVIGSCASCHSLHGRVRGPGLPAKSN